MKRLSLLLLQFLLLISLLSCTPAYAGASERAADGTYQITAFESDPFGGGDSMWTGTAWKVSDTEMVTAGHVCDPDGGPAPVFRVFNTDGQSWPATVVKFDHNWFTGSDLCVLKASPPGPALRLAPDMPAYDSPVFYVGAARGVWSDGMRPIFHGNYAGGNLVTIHGSPGASGSAMQSKDGVIGVLVAGIPGTGLIFIIPLADLRAFLDESGV